MVTMIIYSDFTEKTKTSNALFHIVKQPKIRFPIEAFGNDIILFLSFPRFVSGNPK